MCNCRTLQAKHGVLCWCTPKIITVFDICRSDFESMIASVQGSVSLHIISVVLSASRV